MKIHIQDDLYITSDTNNVCLSKQTFTVDKKTGDKVEQIHHLSYHSSIEGVLKAFLRREINQCEATSLKELHDFIEGVKKTIEDLTKDLK